VESLVHETGEDKKFVIHPLPFSAMHFIISQAFVCDLGGQV
jgi:hypothetical protein